MIEQPDINTENTCNAFNHIQIYSELAVSVLVNNGKPLYISSVLQKVDLILILVPLFGIFYTYNCFSCYLVACSVFDFGSMTLEVN